MADDNHDLRGQTDAMDLEAEGLELFRHHIGRPHFLEGGFRMAVDIMSPAGHVFMKRGNAVDDRHGILRKI